MPVDDLTRKRLAIVAFHNATADRLERQAVALFRQSGVSRAAARHAAAMPAEEVRRAYVAIRAECEKARKEKRGKGSEAVVVTMTEESGRKN